MEVFKLLSVFVLTLTILQMGSFLTVVVLWKIKRQHIQAEHATVLCHPAVPDGDDERVSCRSVETILNTKIEEEVERKARNGLHTESSLLEFFGKDECLETLKGSSILLKGISLKTQRTGSGMVHWLSLANPDSKGYLSYNDGTIDITESGFYYMSFQVMVNNQEPINNTNVLQETRSENTFIKHSIIHRSSIGGRTVVLGNVRHDGCQAGTRTINTGGMFQLKEGDSVHLHSSSVESIVRDTGHHSFMMYKI